MLRAPILPIALAAWLWAPVALANGGGYAFGVDFTGTVAPFQPSGAQHVQIMEEKLDIELRRTDALVVVRYTMKNSSGRAVRVRFGFPVEAQSDWEEDAPQPGDPGYADYTTRKRKESFQQLHDYTVVANGVRVGAELVLEPFASGKVKPFPGSDALKKIAAWMVSEVTFPPLHPVSLEIRYRADYVGEATSVSSDVSWPAVSFRYRLSTGAVWKGPIAKGTVTVRTDGISPYEVEIAAPRDRFVREGDRWTWTFRNLEPTLADDINILAMPGFREVDDYQHGEEAPQARTTYIERAGKWGAGHQRFTASASSTLAPAAAHDFGARNLTKVTPRAPWAEGVPGSGVGEWVELVPTTAAPLLALRILPGFWSWEQERQFIHCSRPSRVEILLNGEHRLMATLGDKSEAQLIPILDYGKPVSKLRVTILDVHPGSTDSPACITRVVLYDLLDQKPQMRGAR